MGKKALEKMVSEIVDKHFVEMFCEFEDSLGIDDGGVIDYFAEPVDVFDRLQEEVTTALFNVAVDYTSVNWEEE